MLKKGDFVKVKDGTELETGEYTQNWAGEIIEVSKINEDHNAYNIHLDALTMNELSTAYIKDSATKKVTAHQYAFLKEDLLPSERRDTDQERATALEKLFVKMAQMGDFKNDYIEIHEGWVQAYQKSSFYDTLTDTQKEHAAYTASSFLDHMYRYFQISPKQWNTEYVAEVCLDIIPRKVMDSSEFFENYGDILISFLKFFQEHTGILTEKLWQYVQTIKAEIPKRANDSQNWGIAKSIAVQAKEEGVDLSDQNQLDQFIRRYNENLPSPPTSPRLFPPSNPIKNSYKDIGRNQRISVKYTDGRVVEDIKFKKVKKDLESGACKLI